MADEAQYIKNAGTQAAKAVKELSAGCRFALTGTPIENKLSDLWSIFDFIMPGYLYDYGKFREEIEVPVVQGEDAVALKRLQRMTAPFILRRKKQDVLKDLPDKLEKTIYIQLAEEQRKLYDARVQRIRMELGRTDGGTVPGRQHQIPGGAHRPAADLLRARLCVMKIIREVPPRRTPA